MSYFVIYILSRRQDDFICTLAKLSRNFLLCRLKNVICHTMKRQCERTLVVCACVFLCIVIIVSWHREVARGHVHASEIKEKSL